MWAPFGVVLVVATLALAGLSHRAEAQDVLSPKEAYPYEITADADEILLEFSVLDGYYLYREKFNFSTTSADDSTEFELGLQGCADIGLCYPPQKWPSTVELPPRPETATDRTASLLAGTTSDEPLPVEQAFIANPRFDQANELTVVWQIEPGYYLYRDKFTFEVDGEIGLATARLPDGVAHTDENFGDVEIYDGSVILGTPQFPDGEIHSDEFFGEQVIYRHDFEIAVPYMRDRVEIIVPFTRASPDEQQLTITAGYQGCKDESLCYPPAEQVFELTLPASSEFAGDLPVMVSEQDRFSALILGDSWLAFLGAFYIAGLALSLTPCVLPMVPILSSIIAGQGQQVSAQRGFWLSVSYVLGMAVTYTAAGALAALAGSQIQAMFQKPWIIASFAGLFGIMALGMFGVFELQMPTAIQSRISQLANKQKGGTFLGTAIVGALTALIVTTCVAPPLIGALAVIGQSGDVMRGATALFVLSIGMGTPLLLVGASAGKLLPKVGPWMNTIKAGFGVMMVGIAIWMLERVLPGTVTLVLWALLIFLTGVFLGAFEGLPVGPSPARRLAKGFGVLACLYGAIMLIGAMLGGESPLEPIPRGTSGFAGAPAEAEGPDFTQVETIAELESLLGQARAASQPVMIDFTADWCISCKEMEAYTFPDAGVVAALEPFMLLRADVTENNDDDKALLSYFGAFGPPTIAFFNRTGTEVEPYEIVGYVPAAEFSTHVTAVAAL